MVEGMRRWVLRAVAVYLLASLGAGIVLGEFALQRGHLSGGSRDVRRRAEAVATAHGARREPIRLIAADGVPLSGWLFTRGSAGHDTVIVTHG
jgi:hypothetical protein